VKFEDRDVLQLPNAGSEADTLPGPAVPQESVDDLVGRGVGEQTLALLLAALPRPHLRTIN